MNILLVSHFFTPYSQVGAKRMTALAKFLSDKGNSVYVIKANDMEYGDKVVQPYCFNKNVKIIQLPTFANSAVIKKITRSGQYWKIIKKLLTNERFERLIVSAGPFNYFSVVKRAKKMQPHLQCVLDFRDILDGSQTQHGKVLLLKKIGFYLDLKTEKQAVTSADWCITVTDSMNEFYKRRYQNAVNKFICIKNGYDDVTITDRVKEEIERRAYSGNNNGNTYKIGIFGKYSFYDNGYIEFLILAVKKLIADGKKIQILQFGLEEQKLKEAFHEAGLESAYHWIKSEGYDIDILKLQDCNAVITTNYFPEALGTKIFDYILINRPIIAVTPYPKGELATLTHKFKNGFVCNSSDEMVKYISKLINNNIGILDEDEQKKKKYGRYAQFEKMQKIVDTL